MEIVRLTHVDANLAHALTSLFDKGKTWDDEQGRLFLSNPDNALFVARDKEILCGFATAHRLQRFDRRQAEVLLYEIGVDEACRRRGIGSGLIGAVNLWASQVGADEVWVLTERTNQAAMALYRVTGGQEDGPYTTMFTYDVQALGFEVRSDCDANRRPG